MSYTRFSWVMAGLLAAGCGGVQVDQRTPGEAGVGQLAVTLDGSNMFEGVTAVDIKVINGAIHDCGDPGEQHKVVPLMGEPGFANAFFSIEPGRYVICLDALDANGHILPNCVGGGPAVVMAGLTTVVSPALTCYGPERGALQVHVGFNHPPVIEDFQANPAEQFITTCSSAGLHVTATDQDGDPLQYQWEVVGKPEGGIISDLVGFGADATFAPRARGTWKIEVTVTDGKRASKAIVDFFADVQLCPSER